MAVRNLNWYNLQSTRRYPLSDNATGETDDGKSLPNNIIVDCNITLEKWNDFFTKPYLAAVTVSPGIVTAVFNDEYGAIAAVSLPKPVDINRHYTLEPLRNGVAGWVVFGYGIDTNFFGRFSSAKQSEINSRSYRFWPGPVTSMAVDGSVDVLQGLVRLKFDAPLTYRIERVESSSNINDAGYINAVFIGLDKNLLSENYDPESHFLADCGKRPESETCPKTPIITINGVYPDCAGNIDITFRDLVAGPITKVIQEETAGGQEISKRVCDGGIVIATEYGLNDVCEETANKIPNFFNDQCCPVRFATIAARDAANPVDYGFEVGSYCQIVNDGDSAPTYYRIRAFRGEVPVWVTAVEETDKELAALLQHCSWPDPTSLIVEETITLESRADWPEVTVPVCVDFCSCANDVPYLDFISGRFQFATIQAPPGCPTCDHVEGGGGGNKDEEFLTQEKHKVLVLTPGYSDEASVALLKASRSDWTVGKTISTTLNMSSEGRQFNGGIVLNYVVDRTGFNDILQYYTFTVNTISRVMRFSYWQNLDEVIIAETTISRLDTDRWYNLAVTPTIVGQSVVIRASVAEVSGENATPLGLFSGLIIPLSQYEPLIGAVGITATNSITYFNELRVS